VALYIFTKVDLGTNCFIRRIIPIPFEAFVTYFGFDDSIKDVHQ
jgi:hypothetical protein